LTNRRVPKQNDDDDDINDEDDDDNDLPQLIRRDERARTEERLPAPSITAVRRAFERQQTLPQSDWVNETSVGCPQSQSEGVRGKSEPPNESESFEWGEGEGEERRVEEQEQDHLSKLSLAEKLKIFTISPCPQIKVT